MYKALTRIRHDGKLHQKGDILPPMFDEEIDRLLDLGAIESIGDDEPEVIEVPAASKAQTAPSGEVSTGAMPEGIDPALLSENAEDENDSASEGPAEGEESETEQAVPSGVDPDLVPPAE